MHVHLSGRNARPEPTAIQKLIFARSSFFVPFKAVTPHLPRVDLPPRAWPARGGHREIRVGRIPGTGSHISAKPKG